MSEKLTKNPPITDYSLYKYNIRRRYETCNAGKKTAIRRHMIPKYCPEATFYDYLKIKITESRDIPGEILKQFSILFNVPMECLFTDKVINNE